MSKSEHVLFKINIFFLLQFNFSSDRNYKKQAQMFQQNHSLALHTVEIFCNLILRYLFYDISELDLRSTQTTLLDLD